MGDVSGQTELLVQANGIRSHMSLSEYTLGGESQEECTGSGYFLCATLIGNISWGSVWLLKLQHPITITSNFNNVGTWEGTWGWCHSWEFWSAGRDYMSLNLRSKSLHRKIQITHEYPKSGSAAIPKGHWVLWVFPYRKHRPPSSHSWSPHCFNSCKQLLKF